MYVIGGCMLEIKKVTKKYGDKIAINDVSLSVKDGEIFGFIGHNGAGKTTLIKSIVGIHDFDEGEIIINGISMKDNPIECKKMIAYIPDNPNLYLNLKGIDFLNFIGDVYEVDSERREQLINKYATKFEILSNLGDVISSYSHGMKQKLAIISALIHEPKVLVLDEPFVGLDPASSKNLKDIMKELCKQKTSVFFSSHVLEVVEKLCDEVAIIKNGKIIAQGKTSDIIGKEDLEKVFLELTNEK